MEWPPGVATFTITDAKAEVFRLKLARESRGGLRPSLARLLEGRQEKRHNGRILYLHPHQLTRAHLPASRAFTCAVCTSRDMKERCFLFVWRVCRGTLRGGERKWLSEAPAEGLTGRWRKGVICPLVFREKERKEEEERQWQQVAFRSGNGAARQIRAAVLSLLPA